MRFEEGQTLADRYRLARKLGEGAMGEVHEAEDLELHRRVALQILHPHVAERAHARERFEREAVAAGRLGSPHVVEVLDAGDLEGGGRYVAMEMLEGETLAQRLQAHGRLAPEEAVRLLVQLLEGLAAAHAAGIVHKNLKPANVFLAHARDRAPAGSVKILDFGASKFADGEGMTMTGTNAVLGMPYYMSPEQAKGASVIDERTDVYSAGVILYECLTGHMPFEAATVTDLVFRILLEQPPPLDELAPDLDPALAAVVATAMAREPGERFQSARAFHDALVGCARRADDAAEVPLTGPTPRAFAAPAIGDLARSASRSGTHPAARPAAREIPPAAPSEGDTLIWDRPRGSRLSAVVVPLGVLGTILAAAAILFTFRPGPDRAATPSPVPAAAAPPSATASALPPPKPATASETAAPAASPAPPAASSALSPAPAKPPGTSTSRAFQPRRPIRRTVPSEL